MRSSSNTQFKNKGCLDVKGKFKLDLSRISLNDSNHHQQQQLRQQQYLQSSQFLEKPGNQHNQLLQKTNATSSERCRKSTHQPMSISIFDSFNNNPSVFGFDTISNVSNLCKATPQFRGIQNSSKNFDLLPSDIDINPENENKQQFDQESFMNSISRENLAFRDLSENQISLEKFQEMQKTEQKCRKEVITSILRDCWTERSLCHQESARITPKSISPIRNNTKLQVLQEQDISFDSFGSPNKYSHRQGLTEVSPIPKEREITQENDSSMPIKYLATPRTARKNILPITTALEYDGFTIPQSQQQEQKSQQCSMRKQSSSRNSSLRVVYSAASSPSHHTEKSDEDYFKLKYQYGSLKIKATLKKQDSKLKSVALNLFSLVQ